jgi:protoporphyrinogen oxidase
MSVGAPPCHGRDVGIVGGGLLGLSVAYRLAQAGVAVTVYERDRQLGGLAGTTRLAGIPVDRYYHATLPTDDRVLGLAQELGMGDDVRFRRTGGGFYHDGRIASMSTVGELLRFPGLRPTDRVRLGAFAARCQLKSDYADLEDLTLEDWLLRACGKRLWERLWRPLLDSKFDGRYDDLPATYLWSRSRRMASTRDRSSKEVLGWLRGGYQRLVDALGDAIRAQGGEVHTSTPVRFIPSKGGRAMGVVLDTGLRTHDLVLTTILRPNMEHMLAGDLVEAMGPDPCRYLGVVCLVARLRHSVSPFYALNITDRRIPLTSVVETTHVVDPEAVGGTLIYVPRYVQPDSPELERSSIEIAHEYLGHVRTMFPALQPEDVLATQVARARFAEPVHRVGDHPRARPALVAPGLAVASSADVYPDIVHGQAIIGVAERVAGELLTQLAPAERPLEVAA